MVSATGLFGAEMGDVVDETAVYLAAGSNDLEVSDGFPPDCLLIFGWRQMKISNPNCDFELF